jgi:superfamily II DNA/RNA helicase
VCFFVAAMAAFDKLGLAAWLKKIIREMGYVAPRPIQEHCIPPILQGFYLFCCCAHHLMALVFFFKLSEK